MAGCIICDYSAERLDNRIDSIYSERWDTFCHASCCPFLNDEEATANECLFCEHYSGIANKWF